MRGGERVLEELCKLFPSAHLYTLLHVPGSVSPLLEEMDIRTSFIQRLPGAPHRFRAYLPLFPSAIESFDLRGYDLVTGGNHAFCTTRMHGDPARGVVDEYGRCHDLDNLFIADTGIFPQCTSVNPMFTGMALAHRQSAQIAAAL